MSTSPTPPTTPVAQPSTLTTLLNIALGLVPLAESFIPGASAFTGITTAILPGIKQLITDLSAASGQSVAEIVAQTQTDITSLDSEMVTFILAEGGTP